MYFKSEQLTQKQLYKFIMGSVIPRPVALVSSVSTDNVVNLAPFSFFNVVSYDPPIVSISVQRVNGQMKDTAKNITQQKEAVVHIVDGDNVEMANQTAKSLLPFESELTISAFQAHSSQMVAVPYVTPMKIAFETVLYDHVIIQTEQQTPAADLLLLKIVGIHIDERVYDDGYIDPITLHPVSRLAGQTYATLGKLFELERPN